jgi:pimeloyl-ACP methyl ester carboxylesterase
VAVAQIEGHSIAYHERGAGPPVVFLHGWPADGREFVHQIDGLSDAHRVIAWDAPGAGGSTDPEEGASLEAWADWLAQFVHTLDLDAVHVAGLSWGGGLALAFARRHPSLVRSLVLMSAYAGWGGSLPAHEVQRRLALMIENTRRPLEQWVPALLETLLPRGSARSLEDELTAIIADYHPAGTRVALRAFAEADLRPALPEIDVPTLMIYGELDVRSPREVWEPIHEAIPDSRLVLIPEVGHMVDMQAPDRCNSEIRTFVADVEQRCSQ